jgi:hypothetical protein
MSVRVFFSIANERKMRCPPFHRRSRVLKPEVREEFRKIVYGYMSRVRRGDANLVFPERKIRLHRREAI